MESGTKINITTQQLMDGSALLHTCVDWDGLLNVERLGAGRGAGAWFRGRANLEHLAALRTQPERRHHERCHTLGQGRLSLCWVEPSVCRENMYAAILSQAVRRGTHYRPRSAVHAPIGSSVHTPERAVSELSFDTLVSPAA